MGEIALTKAPELAGIEKTKAEKIEATFEPMVEMLKEFDGRYNEIIAIAEEDITEDTLADAKRLRLDISKVRIETDKIRKAEKEEYLRAGKAIDGVSNILKWAVTEKENKLKEIENYYENKEKERLEKLQKERVDKLIPYLENAEEIDLASMQDDVFDAYFSSKKKAYEDRIEAERKAEEERKRKEEEDRLENERIRAENERLRKEKEEKDRKIEEERKRREEEDRKRREKEEADRKAREEAEKKKEEENRKKLEEERKAREEAERKLREEEEKKRLIEEARIAEEKALEKISNARADKPKRELVSTEILQLRQRLIDRGLTFKDPETQKKYNEFINEGLPKASEMFK